MRLDLAWIAVVGLLLASPAALADESPALSRGQTVYVPVYSELQYGNLNDSGRPSRMPLSAMLSIRNTDPAQTITVRSARYYDGTGKLLREYLDVPRALGPLQSTELFIEHKDLAGGAGASFLVVWESASPANRPVIEAVHALFFGNQSTAFVTTGREIRSPGP